jgi:hypothetical protein
MVPPGHLDGLADSCVVRAPCAGLRSQPNLSAGEAGGTTAKLHWFDFDMTAEIDFATSPSLR